MSLCERIIERVKAREAFGMSKYGKPLDPLKDKRKFVLEAIEELLDALFYLEAHLEKGTRDHRYNATQNGKARYKRYSRSKKGKARAKRYKDKPEAKERASWYMRQFKKSKKIENMIL